MKKTVLCWAICSFAQGLLAQNGVPSLAGAYGAGAGNAAVTYTNLYSAVGNQAGLAHVEQFGAAVFAERRYNLADLQSVVPLLLCLRGRVRLHYRSVVLAKAKNM